MDVTYVSRDEALCVAAGRVQDVEVIVDIGSGIRPQTFIKPYVHICVDAHRAYLERLRKEVADDPRYVFLNAPWEQVLDKFIDKSVDTVFALDFIEHLEKEEGLRMLRAAERVARRQVVIFTPHGFFPQSHEDVDRWGMDGGYWQTHRSGWDFEDFGEGWAFVCCPDFIQIDEHNQPMEKPMGAIWAFRNFDGPGDKRRYYVMEEDSAWAHFKETLKQALPATAYNGLRSAWAALLYATHRSRPSSSEGAKTRDGRPSGG